MKLKTLKGIREYLPEEQSIREAIIEILKNNFKKYGYKPMETSILEFYDIATKKYVVGSEMSEIVNEIYKLKDRGNRKLCLRYELTFKLAKLIGMRQELRMPIKRYEIGKIFRDGPTKKTRLREFTQCDVDCVGIKSLAIDAEFMALIFDVFKQLKLDVFIKVNNRKFLFGLLEECGIEKKKCIEAMLTIDKLDKYGRKRVINELIAKKISEDAIKKLFLYFDKVKDLSNNEKIEFFKKNLKNENAIKGLQELEEFFYFCNIIAQNNLENIVFVPSLARGLAYYTGMIWEVYLKDSTIKSSVAAGGRWDELIAKFLQSKKEYPASGMAFGLDVIYEAIKEKNIQIEIKNIPKVLIIPINTLNECLKVAKALRDAGISTDVAIEKNLSKALDYANKEGIRYCLIIGQKELSEKKLRLRDMQTGKEELLGQDEIIKKLK